MPWTPCRISLEITRSSSAVFQGMFPRPPSWISIRIFPNPFWYFKMIFLRTLFEDSFRSFFQNIYVKMIPVFSDFFSRNHSKDFSENVIKYLFFCRIPIFFLEFTERLLLVFFFKNSSVNFHRNFSKDSYFDYFSISSKNHSKILLGVF